MIVSAVAKPIFVVIGGPNGSGKTTVAARAVGVPIINVDEIAKTLGRSDPMVAAAEASIIARERSDAFFAAKQSFGVETTLNAKNDLGLLRKAAAKGYSTQAILIWSGGLEVSLERVALRVARKGHHVPPNEIRLRYEAAVEALPIVLGAVDSAVLFLNERPEALGPEIILQAEQGVVVTLVDRPPAWLRAGFQLWRAPLAIGASLTRLAADPQIYRAEQLIKQKASGSKA